MSTLANQGFGIASIHSHLKIGGASNSERNRNVPIGRTGDIQVTRLMMVVSYIELSNSMR